MSTSLLSALGFEIAKHLTTSYVIDKSFGQAKKLIARNKVEISLRNALEAAEKRFINESYEGKDIDLCHAVLKLPVATLPSINNELIEFSKKPRTAVLEKAIYDQLKKDFPNIDENRIETNAQNYAKFVLEEITLVDKNIRETLRDISVFNIESHMEESESLLRDIKNIIQSEQVREMDIYIPQKPTIPLIGRAKEKQEVLSSLHSSMPLVFIVGPGGIGKTALTLEIAHLCREQSMFELIVWMSAKEEEFVVNQLTAARERRRPDVKNLDDIFNVIGRTAGIPISDYPRIKKEEIVISILSKKRCLVVLDNFETLEDKDAISNFLKFGIPYPSKFIATSRQSIEAGNIVHIGGMSKEDSKIFIKTLADNFGITNSLLTDEKVLDDIRKWSGGVPLVMKLIVGQMNDKFGKKDIENLLAKDLKDQELIFFCLGGSYAPLPIVDKHVLQAVALFDRPLTRKAVSTIVELGAGILDESLKNLQGKSLIDYYQSNQEWTFSMLPLTRTYVRSQPFNEINEFFSRASKYYSKLTTEYKHDFYLLEREFENILHILDWCHDEDKGAFIDLFSNISLYLGIRGMNVERLKYAEESIRFAKEIGLYEKSAWIEVFDYGWILQNRGIEEQKIAETLYLNNIKKYDGKVEYLKVVALAYRNLALLKRITFEEGNTDEKSLGMLQEARELAEISLKYWQKTDDSYWIAATKDILGGIAIDVGDYDAAENYYLDALEIDIKSNDKEGQALATSNLGRVNIKKGKYADALFLLQEALQIDIELKRLHGIATELRRQAYVYDRLGDCDKAEDFLKKSADMYLELGSKLRYSKIIEEISLVQRKRMGETLDFLF